MLKIEFHDEGHKYIVDGQRWPSVTQILAPLSDFSAVPPQVLERARWFGQCVHKAVELKVKGTLDADSLDEPVRETLAQFDAVMAVKGFKPMSAELRVGHPRLKYAGTLDLIAVDSHTGKPVLVDIKTGQKAPTVGPQTAAYAACVKADGGPDMMRYCFYLTPTSSHCELLNDASDFAIFQSVLNLYRFKEKHYGPSKSTGN